MGLRSKSSQLTQRRVVGEAVSLVTFSNDARNAISSFDAVSQDVFRIRVWLTVVAVFGCVCVCA